ncbi:hypothetical protein L208DRAFT_1249400, partial [Tricholoma matsutake]
ELGLYFDSTRFIIDDADAGIESDLEVDELSLHGDWGDGDLQESLIQLAVEAGDNPLDEDWLPYELKKKKKPRTERPKEYVKGPDIMSQSKCTQCCYQNASHNQKTLDCFFSVGGICSESVTIQRESIKVDPTNDL